MKDRRMKKLLFIFLLLIGVISLLPALQRELVVVEIATGTWCGYCPGAAMGAHDLLQNGIDVAIVKNHNGDTFANTYSNARNTYYGVTGYPTAFFDGLNPVVGGSASQSMYSQYLPRVNARLAVPSHYSISAFGVGSGTNWTVIVNVSKPEADANTNVVLHSSLTQSNIPYNWGNQTTVENVNRLMSPSQNGTPISLNTGESTSVTLNFTTQSAWPLADLELVLWLQNTTTKEILQGTKYALSELPPADPVSTDMLIFPDTSINTTNTMPLMFANMNNYAINGTITSDNPAFIPSVSTITIPASSSQTISVNFSPTAAQVYNGVLTINSNFPNNPQLTVMCTGTAFSNTPPSVSNVTVSGVPVVFQTLTGNYVYADPEGHIEGNSVKKWLRIVDGVPTEITGATGTNYQIQEADIGHSLVFKVTPVDYYGLAGTPTLSNATPTIIPLPCPQSFNAVLQPPNTVVCTWERPQYFDGRAFIGYRLSRDGLNIQTIPNPSTLSFTDTFVSDGSHQYCIYALYGDPAGISDPSPIVTVVVGVGNEDLVANPAMNIRVSPNPFSSQASFDITAKANLNSSLEIYNLKGQLIKSIPVLTDAKGQAQLNWDGSTADGRKAISGVYIYRFASGDQTLSGKLVITH